MEESHKGNVSIPEVIYIILAIGACLLIQLLNVSISDIIDINGAVIGFFFICFQFSRLVSARRQDTFTGFS